MPFFKTLAASLLGSLALSGGVVGRDLAADDGQPPAVNTSSAKCEVVAIGFSKVSNDKAIASASADASAYVCGKGTKTDGDIASATASAFALAVAHASAKCELSGDASAYVDASANAKAAALVWVAAYADAFASAGDCEKCSAYASSWGYIEKHVFLKAVADAEVHINKYTDGGQLVLHVVDYQRSIQKVVATAFAKALAGAKNYKNSDGCLAWVNAGGCIWTPGKGDQCFECKALAVSVGAIKEIDALAVAVAHAAAWTCADHAVDIATAEDTAKSVAKALAIAISYIWAECEQDGNGFACASAGTHIEQTAHAVAVAYAELWAGAYVCHGTCNVNVDAAVLAIGEILVKAATKAYGGLCVGEGGHWTVEDLAIDIEKESLTAVAEASVAAISIAPHVCIAGGYVKATVH